MPAIPGFVEEYVMFPTALPDCAVTQRCVMQAGQMLERGA